MLVKGFFGMESHFETNKNTSKRYGLARYMYLHVYRAT